MKKNSILNAIKGQNVVILGFGREGVSTYKFIRRYFPEQPITISDKSEVLNTEEFKSDRHLTVITGEKYDQGLDQYDLIFKTPGVNLNHLNYFIPPYKITSQTDLFIRAFRDQIIGVTGTKGKSTTSSLIYHILYNSHYPTILAGNIGIPFFDIIEQITLKTIVVAELSAHQLEFLQQSPTKAIFLNVYQEHLDHFNSFNSYQLAKFNITKFQTENDILIYNQDDDHIPLLLQSHALKRRFYQFSIKKPVATGAYYHDGQIILSENGEVKSEFEISEFSHLPGIHNHYNIMAAILACKTMNISDDMLIEHLKTFKGLEHRIEYVGNFAGIQFYNDSISTIPEATIAALKALKKVDVLILGGFDRGIEYTQLIQYLVENPVQHIAFTGPAGNRILTEWKASFSAPSHYIHTNNYSEIVDFAFEYGKKGKICLLSPAASSYNQFKNFEERGTYFKELVKNKK